MNSIRRRLLWTLLVGVGVLLFAAAGGVYAQILDEIDELFDVQLQRVAYTYQSFPDAHPLPAVTSSGDEDNPLEQLVVEVRRSGIAAPVYHSRAHALFPADAPGGWSTRVINGARWRIYRADLNGRSVEVGQPVAVRRAAAEEIAMQLLLPLLAALPLVGLLIWLGVGRGLRPLAKTARDVQQRSPSDLSPLPVAPLPRELTPLVTSFNELMARLERASKMQKTFVADAAHELLTPLTALQLQVQWLERVGGGAERASVQAELRAGLARTIHLARQLLTLARQDPERPVPHAMVELEALASEVVAACAVMARARNVDLGLARTTSTRVVGDREALRILLENLVDNAVKYTPRGGRVDVSVSVADQCATLTVADSGDGVPAQDLDRVFDRFYRQPGQETTGSGLGLAIAREIATRHGACLTLKNGGALGGLIAECRFQRS